MSRKGYGNPIKKNGDFADPYVLKYNGRYYLYATNADIRCWSSENLIDWDLEGATIDESVFPDKIPFAPEVIYYNGEFYMYTSPSGQGHFVLKSSNPTGPFIKITENIGHNIDASVFVDDDGELYFYWAHDDGIKGAKMISPSVVEGNETDTGAFMYGWTEGPMVVKRDGLYYMTYTGNHYLSPGYRVNAAFSHHPLGPFKDCENNPILLHTRGKNIGLGHSSTVKGPDLVRDYIIYHNMNKDLSRDLNIDEIRFSKGEVLVAGPSETEQDRPEFPLYAMPPSLEKFLDAFCISYGEVTKLEKDYLIFDGGIRCQTKSDLPKNGIIELNLVSFTNEYGLEFGCLDFRFNKEKQSLSIINKNDAVTVYFYELYAGYRHEVLHCIRLKYTETFLELFLDHILVSKVSFSYINSKKLAVYAEEGHMGIGYLAWNSLENVENSMLYPIPCTLSADGEVRLNAERKGEYEIIEYAEKEESSVSSFVVNGTEYIPVQRVLHYSRYIIPLNKGENILEPPIMGSLPVKRRYFVDSYALPSEKNSFREYMENFTGKKLLLEKLENNVRIHICFHGDIRGEVGIIFRADELSLGGEGDDELLGINFFVGYAISIRENTLILSKHRYDCRILEAVDTGGCRDMNLDLSFNRIKVFCEGKECPIIDYADEYPIFFGGLGIRGIACEKADVSIEIK